MFGFKNYLAVNYVAAKIGSRKINFMEKEEEIEEEDEGKR